MRPEQDAFIEQLFHAHFNELEIYAYALLKNRSDAETAVQDAFHTAYLKMDEIKSCQNPVDWLKDTIKNISQNMCKRKVMRRRWKTALAVTVTSICLIISIAAAQRAGLDVFGPLAHWADGVFPFSNLQSETADTSFIEDANASSEDPPKSVETLATSQKLSYSSLQDALDAFSITEISEPTKLPSGYTLDRIRGGYTMQLSLDARYVNGEDILTISLIAHNDHPSMQLEKTDEPVENININGFNCYFFKNTNNQTVAWLTEHYECFIFAPLEIERNVLQEIVLDMLS